MMRRRGAKSFSGHATEVPDSASEMPRSARELPNPSRAAAEAPRKCHNLPRFDHEVAEKCQTFFRLRHDSDDDCHDPAKACRGNATICQRAAKLRGTGHPLGGLRGAGRGTSIGLRCRSARPPGRPASSKAQPLPIRTSAVHCAQRADSPRSRHGGHPLPLLPDVGSTEHLPPLPLRSPLGQVQQSPALPLRLLARGEHAHCISEPHPEGALACGAPRAAPWSWPAACSTETRRGAHLRGECSQSPRKERSCPRPLRDATAARP